MAQYAIRHNDARCPVGKPWAVVDSETNEPQGWHATRGSARVQHEALLAHLARGEDPDDAADGKLAEEKQREAEAARHRPMPPTVSYSTSPTHIW